MCCDTPCEINFSHGIFQQEMEYFVVVCFVDSRNPLSTGFSQFSSHKFLPPGQTTALLKMHENIHPLGLCLAENIHIVCGPNK